MIFIELHRRIGSAVMVNVAAMTSAWRHRDTTIVTTVADQFHVTETPSEIWELIAQAEVDYNRMVLGRATEIAIEETKRAVGLE